LSAFVTPFVRLSGKKRKPRLARRTITKGPEGKIKKNNLKKLLCVRRGGLCVALCAPLW